jgi:hypothetical protein
MKNILLKSILVFVVMSILNVWLVDASVRFLGLPGDFGILSFAVLIGCFIISGVGFVTILIFRNTYYSLFRVIILFEILYLFMLMLTGTNPFTYFSERTDRKFLNVLLYLNSIAVFLALCIFNFIYLKIISIKRKKIS